ncbi:VanW family protein [Cytobacillus spongiae]|uniref:VanW family protein n=1 Tax=Cytobacillus spongiae TaxID=2901381 RepID=UPI0032C4AA23
MLMMKLSTFCLLLLPVVHAQNPLHIHLPKEETISIEQNALYVPFVDEPLLNEERYEMLISEVRKEVFLPPQNAYLNESNQIVSEKPGYKLDEIKFREFILSYLISRDKNHLTAPLKVMYPKVDSETIAHIRTEQIGSYVTYFNVHNVERSQNISLAAEKINNTVVFPGEEFSFNGVVGKRTRDKGYKKAPVILKGELSEDIGGGICQVSSTLFNAVDQAGVEIVELYHHSKRVPYVPDGRDATVSWYGPDFVFKNTYNQPLLIRAKVRDGQVHITIYSSEFINVKKRNVPSALHP